MNGFEILALVLRFNFNFHIVLKRTVSMRKTKTVKNEQFSTFVNIFAKNIFFVELFY